MWLLPVYGLLLTLSTLTHQPDPQSDFAAYAGYVTTDVFLTSHLVGSILGAGLGLVGLVAALGYLSGGPGAGAAALGTALTIVANVLVTAVFAAAAFAQPAIGRGYLSGLAGMPDLNDDVYGAPLVGTAVSGLLLLIIGAVLLGRAISRTSPALRWVGVGYAVLLPLFAVSGFVIDVLQPVFAFGYTVVVLLLAVRLPAATGW